ncbi:MAG: c-type cytochrome, partial [Methylococcales bacterium]|nr:c-type cytochrome [Methylococcales bacterium]
MCTQLNAEAFANEPIIPIPDDVITQPEQVELGRILFNDVRLSVGDQVSCASCHSMSMGGADGQVVSTGVKSEKGSINSPTVLNSSLQFRQFWNGRAETLLEQIDGPIANPKEMGSSWDEVLKKLKEDVFYVAKFNLLYPDGLTIPNIKQAIITFEESLLTPNSRFDQYLRGNHKAITEDELKGYSLFKEYGCVSCHQGVAVGGNLFQKFGTFGDFFVDRGHVTEADFGRFSVTKKEQDRFVFKVPTLRNIELTAPYLHDGSIASLEDAVIVMMKYQLGRKPKEQNVQLIVQFLKT